MFKKGWVQSDSGPACPTSELGLGSLALVPKLLQMARLEKMLKEGVIAVLPPLFPPPPVLDLSMSVGNKTQTWWDGLQMGFHQGFRLSCFSRFQIDSQWVHLHETFTTKLPT